MGNVGYCHAKSGTDAAISWFISGVEDELNLHGAPVTIHAEGLS